MWRKGPVLEHYKNYKLISYAVLVIKKVLCWNQLCSASKAKSMNSIACSTNSLCMYCWWECN